MSFCKLDSEISIEPGGGVNSAAGVVAGCDVFADSLLLADLHAAKERESAAMETKKSRRFIGFISKSAEIKIKECDDGKAKVQDRGAGHLNRRAPRRARRADTTNDGEARIPQISARVARSRSARVV